MENYSKTAFLLIDMQYGFLSPDSPHCIAGAAATVPTCAKAIAIARAKAMPIFFIKRQYREDGSDVESTRYRAWNSPGGGMSPSDSGFGSPRELSPKKGDYTIIKPRWSGFFHTELDIILRRLGIRTLVLAGTTTPNCIRTTCYDANALDYNVVVLSDCTSSQTEEIQKANLEDMKRIGAAIITASDFEDYNEENLVDLSAAIRQEIYSRK